MPTVYVKADSKKAANDKITAGSEVIGVEYSPFNMNEKRIQDYPNGTVVKIWSQRDSSGTPIAKSYGNWDTKKGLIK